MRNISSKIITLRTAKGICIVLCKPETLARIKTNDLPKKDALVVAKAAGLLGVKQTQHLIPHCHPVGIDHFEISYEYLEPDHPIENLSDYHGKHGLVIYGEAKSIGRTGIEMEVLTGITVAALTLYDLLKPIDKEVEITGIKLLSKTGGKTDRLRFYKKSHTCAVLVCSDSVSAGTKQDRSGIKIQEMLQSYNATIADYQIVADETEAIQSQIQEWVEAGISFIFTTGGTGFSPRDVTADAVAQMLDRTAPGITEAMRTFGGQRTPVAMFSRAVAGHIGNTCVVTLPGSTNGVRESLEAILPTVFHAEGMLKGEGH